MLFRAEELTPEQKSAIETLLGRPLAESEDVVVKSVRSDRVRPSILTNEQRERVRAEMDAYFAKIDAHRAQVPVSEEEEEAIILEALRSTRPDYQPID